MYGSLFASTFGNPFALLTVWAAAAKDSVVLLTLLAILGAAFVWSRRVLLQSPERALSVWRVMMIAQFPLLLGVLHLRWKLWTGQSPWQFHSDALISVAVGFLLFAFAAIHWLIVRNR